MENIHSSLMFNTTELNIIVVGGKTEQLRNYYSTDLNTLIPNKYIQFRKVI